MPTRDEALNELQGVFEMIVEEEITFNGLK